LHFQATTTREERNLSLTLTISHGNYLHFTVDILKPVWFLDFKKPNLGCLPDMSFRRAVIPGLENAEDITQAK